MKLAQPLSPSASRLGAWRVTWRGLQRARPTVTLHLCALNGGMTVVIPSLGRYHLDEYVPVQAEWLEPLSALRREFEAR